MSSIMNAIDGYKAYLLLAVAAAVVIVEGAMGLDVPGVVYESATGNWLNDLWALAFGSAMRSALAK